MRPRLACLPLLAAAALGGACWSSGDRNGGYTFDKAMWAPWDVPAL